MTKDVTEQIEYGFSDDECLPITKCICGARFDLWDFSISVYREWADECPECHRKFFFIPYVKIYQVEE